MSYSYSERVSLVDTAFARTHEVLMREDVQAALGYDAVNLAVAAQDYFVPNLCGNTWEVPGSFTDTEKLPVIPTHWGEKARLGASFVHFSPEKRTQLVRELNSLHPKEGTLPLPEIVDMIEGGIRSVWPFPETTLYSPAEASVTHSEQSVHFDGVFEGGRKKLIVRQNPFGCVGIDASLTPPKIVHELVHKAQYDSQSIIRGVAEDMPPDEKELNAYMVGAAVEKAIGEVGIQSTVEALRQRHTKPTNPFQATSALLWSLRVRGMFTIANSLKNER